METYEGKVLGKLKFAYLDNPFEQDSLILQNIFTSQEIDIKIHSLDV